MRLSRRTAGWRTTEGTPCLPCLHHTPILNTKPGQHETMESRSPLAWICTLHKREKPHYGLPKREPRISVCLFPPPTFYLCCKTFPLQTPEARCSWPAAPFKSSFILLFLSFLSSSLSCCSFQARLLSLLKIRGHVLRSLLLPPSTLSLSFSECHNPWKASALHSSVSQKPPI